MHIRTVLLVCAVVLPVRADDPKDQDKNKELAALQGTWRLEGVEVNGVARDLTEKPPRWVIKENKVLYGGSELATLSIVDGTAAPKSVDLMLLPSKRTLEGVFAVDKDTLKICVNSQTEGVKERPLNFDTQGRTDRRLLIFKRETAKDVDPNEGLDGYVGMAIRLHPERMEVVIVDLVDDGPAKKAGLMKDDIVLMVGPGKATDLRTTIDLVRAWKPASEVVFRIRRGEKRLDVKVKIGVMPFHYLD
jgi:uncharacterized protein (TIGR03067 family)